MMNIIASSVESDHYRIVTEWPSDAFDIRLFLQHPKLSLDSLRSSGDGIRKQFECIPQQLCFDFTWYLVYVSMTAFSQVHTS
jgi:hypothetical protein